jgi:hypothetical protein
MDMVMSNLFSFLKKGKSARTVTSVLYDCAARLLTLAENVTYKYFKAKCTGRFLGPKEMMWKFQEKVT